MDVLPEEEILPSWYKLLDHFGLQVLAMITTHHQQTQTLPTEKLMDLLNWWLFFWATDATQAYKAEWGPDLSSSTYKLYASTVHVWASFPHQCQAEDPLRGHVRGLPEATIVGVHLPLARCSQQRSDTSLPLPSAGAGLTPPPTYERTAWGRAPTWQWAATEFSAVMFSLLDPNVETALELLALTWSMSVCAGATLPPSLKEYIFSTTFWKNALRNAYRQWLTTVFKTPT